MGTVRRAYPFRVWLVAFLFLLLLYLPGILLFLHEGIPSVSISSTVSFLQENLQGLLPVANTALAAALWCLAAGFPAGCLLAFSKRKAALMLCLIPVLSLAGLWLFYASSPALLLPPWAVPVLKAAAGLNIPTYVALAVALLPLMVLFVSAFSASVDPALPLAARGLGASRLKAYLTITFPRTLPGALLGYLSVFVTSAALALLNGSPADRAAGPVLLLGSVSLLFTLLLLAICILRVHKTRSLSPC